VNQLAGGNRRLDAIEELDEFLVAMPLHAAAEHGTTEMNPSIPSSSRRKDAAHLR
jgi:hypothetical protein